MTATEELRRLLDERGVEYWDTVGITEYRGENDRTVRCYARPEPMTLDVTIIAAPPEQAVEATLGSDLKAENEKLRELVRHMYTCLDHYEPGDTISCEQCPYDNETWGCDYERLMAELGVDA